MTDARLILHIGAPKCGSSALQTALTMTPDFQSVSGQRFRYTTAVDMFGKLRPVTGHRAAVLGQGSPYGYSSWPNLGPTTSKESLFRCLETVFRDGQQRGFIPVLSSEGWISHAATFSKFLSHMGYPRVDVVAYLRPPVEWLNAAYWQWGIWNLPTLDLWMQRGRLPYSFGTDLEAWSHIPGVRLQVGRSRPDVVNRFQATYDVSLPKVAARNSALPPSMVGVLLRNPALRPTAHDASIEFIFQRWCPPVPGRRLWAIRARHVHAMRPVVDENFAALQRCLSEEQFEDLKQEPRWLQEKPYHEAINAGESPLDDRSELPGFYEALMHGLRVASDTTGLQTGDLPACPDVSADLSEWDAVLVALLQRLRHLDEQARVPSRGRKLLQLVRGVVS